MKNEITTTYINPPIPPRDFDWDARLTYHDGDEGPVGRGPTENAAVLNLLLELPEFDGDGSEQETLVNMAYHAWKEIPS